MVLGKYQTTTIRSIVNLHNNFKLCETPVFTSENLDSGIYFLEQENTPLITF